MLNGYGKFLNSYVHNRKLAFIATNDETIAASGDDNKILLFDKKLNLKKKLQHNPDLKVISFSPNGRYLIAGTGSMPYSVIIYDSKNNYKKVTSFEKHTNSIVGVKFLDDSTIVSCGGNSNEIYIWNVKDKNSIVRIASDGKSIYNVGIKENIVGFDNMNNCSGKNCSKLEKSFNLKTLNIDLINQPKNKNNFKRINSTGLSHSKGGDFGFDNAVLNVNTSRITITKSISDGLSHRCYGWYKDTIISGGSNGHLKIYNIKGVETARLVGHIGAILSIALDGDRLVSGSDDQTIKVWDLKALNNKKLEFVTKDWFTQEWLDYIKSSHFDLDINIQSDIERLYYRMIEETENKEVATQLIVPKNIYPIISLFIGTDNEWVLWTKEGFFNASKNGAKYIGYHINQGSEKEAEFVGVDKLYKAFYRPDLVEKALAGEDLSSYAQNINISDILNGGLAPKVAIKTETRESSKKDIELELEVCTKDGDTFDNPTLLLNGMAVSILDKNRAIKPKNSNQYQECVTFHPLITLSSGENRIGFKATNANGMIESNTDEITINYKGTSNQKPNLHILAIGVDKYRDGDLQLKYSVADAKEITKSLKLNSGGLFGETFTYELFDKDVTKEKILEKFTEVGAKTTREDVFIFYMAGHGITDAKTGAYFYLPSDFRYKNEDSVRTSGVGQDDFTLALSRIQALKSITLIDTCNSGSFAEALASRGVLQKTAIDKLSRATGRATLVASSKDQVALEGYEGHGVFTYTMMEALNGKGYKGGKITIKNLASYIEDVLPERTYQKWGYEQVPQSHITGTDFPIGVK